MTKSHLLQMRGLKPVKGQLGIYNLVSHLLQMRGLKPGNIDCNKRIIKVASFTDAWIETKVEIHRVEMPKVASFTDAWIETVCRQKRNVCKSRIFYRCVD